MRQLTHCPMGQGVRSNPYHDNTPGSLADVSAKLNSSQLRRHFGGKGLRWLLLLRAYVLICRNGIPGSTAGDCVTGCSAAYDSADHTVNH